MEYGVLENGLNLKYLNNHKIVKNWLSLFIAAFAFNLVWESFHSFFYVHYQGGAITYFILTRSAFFDAMVILLMAFVLKELVSKGTLVLLVFSCIVFAVLLEMWALGQGRWAYNALMPIIPIFHVGLTPAIQLGITAYFSYKLAGFTPTPSRV